MDPESLVCMAVTTGDLKLLKIGLLMRMNDYAACLKSVILPACLAGDPDIVLELISAGAQPTENLLWAACREGHLSVVSALLGHELFAVTKQGIVIAIDIAKRHGHPDIMMHLSMVGGETSSENAG